MQYEVATRQLQALVMSRLRRNELATKTLSSAFAYPSRGPAGLTVFPEFEVRHSGVGMACCPRSDSPISFQEVSEAVLQLATARFIGLMPVIRESERAVRGETRPLRLREVSLHNWNTASRAGSGGVDCDACRGARGEKYVHDRAGLAGLFCRALSPGGRCGPPLLDSYTASPSASTSSACV